MLNQDCVASIVAPEDGKYVVQVRETSFGGNGACTYRLHVGGFPRPTAVYPAGGKPGETLQVRWIGDARGEFAQQVTLPTDGSKAKLTPGQLGRWDVFIQSTSVNRKLVHGTIVLHDPYQAPGLPPTWDHTRVSTR